MDALQPGHYWKTPFLWEPGCREPAAAPGLRFDAADDGWLAGAIAEVMAHSLDESDRFAVAQWGSAGAVADLMSVLPQHFDRPAGWWRVAVDAQERPVGFVLPVLFKDAGRWKDGRPQGTIFYMGVLPGFRGRRVALALVDEATRLFRQADCWRIFCDTGTDNAPMVRAFRRAGYLERAPWQRPVG